jgi:hypothetical protein
LDIDNDVLVDLFAAPKDFSREDITVEVGLYKCGAANDCRLIGVDVRDVQNADRWRKTVFVFPGVDETILVGQRIEVRVAVLDSSETDGWFAFGTAAYDSRLKIGDASD